MTTHAVVSPPRERVGTTIKVTSLQPTQICTQFSTLARHVERTGYFLWACQLTMVERQRITVSTFAVFDRLIGMQTNTAHPSKVTKLYGRSGTLLAFLKGVGTYIERNVDVPGLKVSFEGRWLVFANK